MLKRLEYLTLMQNINDYDYTAYFLQKEEQKVLGINIKNKYLNMFFDQVYLDLMLLVKAYLSLIKVSRMDLIIYAFVNGKYYSYLRIKYQQKTYDFELKFPQTIILQQHLSIPIYIEDDVLNESGIKISKNIIEGIC